MAIVRWITVTLGAIVVTTLGLNAFDNLDQPANSLLGSAFTAFSGPSGPCPSDMAYISTSDGGFCIDKYEATAGGSCLHENPQNRTQTDENLSEQQCQPESVAGEIPWRNITHSQAELACARAGKRLPSNQEWYRAALGTPDRDQGWGKDDCNVNTLGSREPDPAGSRSDCTSPAGVYDMNGNVWEWVEEVVYGGMYEGRQLPEQGYVTSIDGDGVPTRTNSNEPDPAFFRDYFWVDPSGDRRMVRGGYWGSVSDAGQYAVNANIEPTFVGNAVGFRCVKEAQI